MIFGSSADVSQLDAVRVETHTGPVYLLPDEALLRSPQQRGDYVRAYCPIHGSDHQRSLSIRRETGWGRCFNAACDAYVLVEPWNRAFAARLRKEAAAYRVPPVRTTLSPTRNGRSVSESATPWQREELRLLAASAPHLCRALPKGNTPGMRRARAYLRSRRIEPDLAAIAGAAYLPYRTDVTSARLLRRWQDRIVFPLTLPTGIGGYIGRSLSDWNAGLGEAVPGWMPSPEPPTRWLKTCPAGWFGPAAPQWSTQVILVEGAFDRLALLAAGFAPHQVVALCGTALPLVWLPEQVRHVILAFDQNQAGRQAANRLVRPLHNLGKAVTICLPSEDRLGTDWSERWQHAGWDGLNPLMRIVTPFSTLG
jgi:hypothetical protein